MQTVLSPVAAIDWRQALIAHRTNTLTKIYARTYPMVLHYIKQHGGQPEDAQDVLQEAIIIFYEKVMQEQLQLNASVTTYLMGISKNLWRQELEKQNRHKNLNLDASTLTEEPALPEPQTLNQNQDLIQFVEQLGNKCRDMLVSFYYAKQSMAIIAAQNQYRTIRSATVQKFKCLERLRKSLAGFSIDYFRE